ncbi:MAG: outer membrane beta-barrel protein [Acidobacteriota bacterium]
MFRKLLRLAVVLLLAGGIFPNVKAQKWEIHPYAGGFFPREADFGELKNEGVYGLKGSVNLTDVFELEGNFGYINHFRAEAVDTPSRSTLFEAAGNFQFPWGRLHPFATAGFGAMRATIDEDLLDPNSGGLDSVNLLGNRLDNGDTFFMFSYGGGVKAERLWGPIGLRGDIRGRTLPNMFGDSLTWLETTGGVTISWGE